jgi:hypothetical protein
VSGFIYFVPRIANAADYEPLGLGYAFDGPPIVTQLPASAGPDGLSGTALHRYEPSLPSRIEWHKAGPDLYVGHNPQAPPTPVELRTPIAVEQGHQVKLRDGNFWTVPRVLACTEREPDREHGLPLVYTGEVGEVEAVVAAEYVPLVQQAGEILHALDSDGGTDTLPDRDSLDFAAALLGVCYRVTLAEVLALELLDTQTLEAVVMDAIDACEHVKCRLPAAVTAGLDKHGVTSWLHVIAVKRNAEEGA